MIAAPPEEPLTSPRIVSDNDGMSTAVLTPAFNFEEIAFRARTALEAGDCGMAINLCRQGLQIRPNEVSLLHDLAAALSGLARHVEALPYIERAEALSPGDLGVRGMHGRILIALHRWREADEIFRAILRDYPDAHGMRVTIGHMWLTGRRPDYAAQYAREALAHAPELLEARVLLGYARLALGDYANGFPDYDQLCRMDEDPIRLDPGKPEYDGWKLNGETVLAYAQSGLGDTLMFCRFATEIAHRGGRVVLMVQPGLGRLVSSLSGIEEVFERGDEPLPPYDFHVSLIRLPSIFKVRKETLFAPNAYLKPPTDEQAEWRKRTDELPGKFRIGVGWRAVGDGARTFPLALLKGIAAIPGVSLISVQKGEGAQEIAQNPPPFPIVDLGSRFGDFGDTAAAIENLDGMICADISVAHVAGAVGKRTWIAAMHGPDWRLCESDEQSAWYPSWRIFKQPSLWDWPGAIARIEAEVMREVMAFAQDSGDPAWLAELDGFSFDCDGSTEPVANECDLDRTKRNIEDLADQGRYAEATALCLNALEANPLDADLSQGLAQLQRVGRMKRRAADSGLAVVSGRDSLSEVRALLASGELGNAEALLEERMRSNGGASPEMASLMGCIRHAQGRRFEAETILINAFAADSKDRETGLELAGLCYGIGAFEMAMETCQRLMENDPLDSEASALMARTEVAKRNQSTADLYKRFVPDGSLVFDVGANIGQSAEALLGAGAGSVVACEPNPRCLASLYEKFQGEGRVKIVPKGIADQEGELPFAACSQISGISTFSQEWREEGRYASIGWDEPSVAQVTTLDQAIAEFGKPSYIKIDVEGFETAVLAGLSHAVPALSFEFSAEFPVATQACIRRLTELGFSRYHIQVGGWKRFIHAEPVSVEQMLEFIAACPDKRLVGDIFAFPG